MYTQSTHKASRDRTEEEKISTGLAVSSALQEERKKKAAQHGKGNFIFLVHD